MISSYFSKKPLDGGRAIYNLGASIYRGQVARVIYPDDADSISKLFVEYDVVVEMPKGGVSTFKNVPKLNSLGGTNDYDETILEPSEHAFTGKNDNTAIFKNRNGTMVAIAFVNSNFERPFILGTFTHPKKSQRKKSDGISRVSVFRGIKTEINSSGELIVTYQSESSPDGKVKRTATGPSIFKIDKAGSIIHDSINGNINHTLSGEKQSLTVTTKNGLKVSVDGIADKVSITTKGGLSLTVDGTADKTTVITAGGSSVTVDGSSDQVKLVDNSGATLNLATGKVAIGASGTEVLDVISQLLQALTQETHTGNLGYPTSPPLNAATYANLKAMIDAIKGSL